MAGETTISGLNKASSIQENDIIPVVSLGDRATEQVSLNTLRNSIYFQNAFSDHTTALGATNKGDMYFIYTDTTETYVKGWVNQGGGTYAAMIGLNGDVIFPAGSLFSALKSYILGVDSVDELRNLEPLYDGQRVNLNSYYSDWRDNYSGLPTGAGTFRYSSSFTISDFTDDSGTIFITKNNKVWIREEVFTSGLPEIQVLWFGASNSFLDDSTSYIQKAADSVAFWVSNKLKTYGPIGQKVRLVLPSQSFISNTVTINSSVTELDMNNGTVLVALNNGSFDTHPTVSGVQVAIHMKGVGIPTVTGQGLNDIFNSLYMPAYSHQKLVYDGSFIYGDRDGKGGFVIHPVQYTAINDTDLNYTVAALIHTSEESTIRNAITIVDNVSFRAFPYGFLNGDYSWGYTFRNVKFIECWKSFKFVNGKDNGELIRFESTISLNCGYVGDIGDWLGDFQWVGGSWDYFYHGGLIGGSDKTAFCNVYLQIGRIEFDPSYGSFVIDGSSTGRKFTLDTPSFLLSSGTIVTDANNVIMFKSAFNDQFELRGPAFNDVSKITYGSSTQYSSAYLRLTDNNRLYLNGPTNFSQIHPFLSPGLLDSGPANEWTITLSSPGTMTSTISNGLVSITTTETSPGLKSATFFIPRKGNAQKSKITGILKSDFGDFNVAFNIRLGTVGSIGDYIGSNSNPDNLLAGIINYPMGTVDSIWRAIYTNIDQSSVYDGIYITINLYNLTSSNGPVTIDSLSTGIITI